MKELKIKKVLTTILTVSILLLIIVLIVIDYPKNRNTFDTKKEDVQAYDYDDANAITVTGVGNFSFVDFVDYATADVETKNWTVTEDGNNCSGRTVKLNGNLDLSGYAFHGIGGTDVYGKPHGIQYTTSFAGTFDGDGHTISNLNITGSPVANEGNQSYHGLFCSLKGATIKNLRIASVKFSGYGNVEDEHSGSACEAHKATYFFGAIAGRSSESTIENCQIDSITLSNSNSGATYYVGGILGGDNRLEEDGDFGYICETDSIGSNTDYAFYWENTFNYIVLGEIIDTAQNAKFGQLIGGIVSNGDGNYKKCYAQWSISPEVLDCQLYYDDSNYPIYNLVKLKGNFTSVDTYECIDLEPTNCISRGNTNAFSSQSSKPGPKSSANYYWYQYSGYNSGVPVLRTFVSWTSYSIKSNVSNCSVNISSIYCPSDATISLGSGSKITVYGEDLIATAGKGYTFINWTLSENTITANFSVKSYTAKFMSNGSQVASKSFNTNTSGSLNYTPVLTGYKFAGWYTSNSTKLFDAGATVSASTMIDKIEDTGIDLDSSSITLYAHWTEYFVAFASASYVSNPSVTKVGAMYNRTVSITQIQ